MGYNYNGRLRSSEILLQEDGTARMIRRAETPEDYFATIYGFDFDHAKRMKKISFSESESENHNQTSIKVVH
ncbi:diaminopimelate decarboxylase [Streptococcus suis]|uniref:Diaminopimelate decarboxylase n=1 Tax=Streptococcus suis TaxID=1307 RepID=A0A0Z8XTA6_STRSU|nr:diaminopimelate decarboxylase [Streptococcus suis]